MEWGDARALFEDARQASWELHRHDVKYNAMEARALALGGGLASAGGRGAGIDRMRTVDAMADYEAMMEREVARWCSIVDHAVAVLYGWDWEHGIARSLGFAYAEALDCIYIQRLSVKETGRRVHFSRPHIYRMRNKAFDYIDAIGLEAAERGE